MHFCQVSTAKCNTPFKTLSPQVPAPCNLISRSNVPARGFRFSSPNVNITDNIIVALIPQVPTLPTYVYVCTYGPNALHNYVWLASRSFLYNELKAALHVTSLQKLIPLSIYTLAWKATGIMYCTCLMGVVTSSFPHPWMLRSWSVLVLLILNVAM